MNCTSPHSCNRYRRQEAAWCLAPTNTGTNRALLAFISSDCSSLTFLNQMTSHILPIRLHSRRKAFGGGGGERELDPHSESPKDFIHTFYEMRALLLLRHTHAVFTRSALNANHVKRLCLKLCNVFISPRLYVFSWHTEMQMISKWKEPVFFLAHIIAF